MKLHNILYLKWRNFLYRNIPAHISDRVDTRDLMNLKTFGGLVSQINNLEKRVKRLETLEKHKNGNCS